MERWVLGGLIAFLVVLSTFTIIAIVQDSREWEAFKAAHACKVVGKMSGSTATTVSPIIGGKGGVAVGSTYIPGKTGWFCDDGVTYWR